MAMENQMRKALKNEDFEIYYQPKYDISQARITGAEALLRWRDSNGEWIPPMEFIELAEENHLILPLGELVLRKVCAQAMEWRHITQSDFHIAVNLSTVQLQQHSLWEIIQEIIDSIGLPYHYLDFEITETALLLDKERAIAILHKFREAGISISLDDFGTGYSSLSMLHSLPLDYLKIDKSFVDPIPADQVSNAMINSIVDLAHNLDLRVIAEGVESEPQFSYLSQAKCDIIQGYYISRPLPPEDFTRILLSNFQVSR